MRRDARLARASRVRLDYLGTDRNLLAVTVICRETLAQSFYTRTLRFANKRISKKIPERDMFVFELKSGLERRRSVEGEASAVQREDREAVRFALASGFALEPSLSY
jgi:hypothetical protein